MAQEISTGLSVRRSNRAVKQRVLVVQPVCRSSAISACSAVHLALSVAFILLCFWHFHWQTTLKFMSCNRWRSNQTKNIEEPSMSLTSNTEQIFQCMQIDGHHVLKANNYDIEGGEPSVFLSESAREFQMQTCPVALCSTSAPS